jgi:predicted deacylase
MSSAAAGVNAFEIGGILLPPGARRTVDLPVSQLSNHTPMHLPVHVVHGRAPGPVIFVSGVIHGDEIQGVEIIRRVLKSPALDALAGTLLAIPIVNGYGFIARSRYLPDRRDLNRSFPGSDRGSLAAQLANLFLKEIVARADIGIDLHTAGAHRTNLPQIRVDKPSARLEALAEAFGAPVVLEAALRPGSLRLAAREIGVDVLLYEGGEALRFDELSIRIGARGVLSVMQALGMVPADAVAPPQRKPVRVRDSSWVRAPDGGIFRAYRGTGDAVAQGELLGMVSDPLGEVEHEVRARLSGIVIGRANLPVVNQGDALFHIAELMRIEAAERHIGAIGSEVETLPLFDEDEII